MTSSASPDADLFHLRGRVAVVTGALGRLGPVWLDGLLNAGATAMGIDMPGVPDTPTIRELIARHGESRLVVRRADVLNRAALEDALAWCRAHMGTPTVLVNNAGIDQPPRATAATHRFEDWPLDAWRPVLEVNLLGAVQASQVFGRAMIEARGGSIVNIGSLYASVAPDARFYEHLPSDPPFLKPPAYGASKAALVNVTRYLATLWARHGVRVNALSPGGVLGDQDAQFRTKFESRVPLGRMAVAADLVGPLVFLASEASRYVTGIELVVDGGFTAW